MLLRPRDRDVVCHASAWPMNMARATCASRCASSPTEEDSATIYHELGHIYYYLAYKDSCRRSSRAARNDGFHEAIGDTIVLSMTPAYLQSIGLVGEGSSRRQGADQRADAHGADEGRVPAVRPDDRPVALGRVRRLDQAGPVQQGMVGAEGASTRASRRRSPRGEADLRSGREVPRAGATRRTRAISSPTSCSSSSTGRCAMPPATRVRCTSARIYGNKAAGAEVLDDARRGREPAVAADAEGADRQRPDGCERDHRIFRAARCVAEGAEQGESVRVVTARLS